MSLSLAEISQSLLTHSLSEKGHLQVVNQFVDGECYMCRLHESIICFPPDFMLVHTNAAF